jgi:DNA-binding transcriptional LysR family regulator
VVLIGSARGYGRSIGKFSAIRAGPAVSTAQCEARRSTDIATQGRIEHECLGYRFPTAKTVYRWQSWRNGREFSVNAAGSIVVNHLSKIALAASGVGLAYTADFIAGHELKKGALETVLDHYCMKSQGLFLYFPSKSQNQPKLRAFIDLATGSLRR